MSQGQGGGPPDHANASDRARERSRRWSDRSSDGSIEVSGDRLDELLDEIDFDNLSPIEEYLLIKTRELE